MLGGLGLGHAFLRARLPSWESSGRFACKLREPGPHLANVIEQLATLLPDRLRVRLELAHPGFRELP
jgi:hypothetical protein